MFTPTLFGRHVFGTDPQSYMTCSSCHLSPQGGGLLTPYGKGIDAAQNMRPQDLSEEFDEFERRWLSYDVRISLSLDRTPPAATGYSFNTSFRSAVGHGDHRLVYAGSVSTPTLTRARTSGAVSLTSRCRSTPGT